MQMNHNVNIFQFINILKLDFQLIFSRLNMDVPQTMPNFKETPQYLLMNAKYPHFKSKLQTPHSFTNRFSPSDQIAYANRLTQLKSKFCEECKAADLSQFLDIIMGCLEGLQAQFVPAAVLVEEFGFDNRDIWAELMKDKISQKYYGQTKDKTQAVWQVKDLEEIKSLYDVESIKKYRKIRKQLGTLLKSIRKFIDKFQNLKEKEEINEVYQEFRKAETQDAKYKKLMEALNKITNIKPDQKLKQFPPQLMEKEEIDEDSKKKKKKTKKGEKEKKQDSNKEKDKESDEEKKANNDNSQEQKEKQKRKKKQEIKKPSKEEVLKSEYGSLKSFFHKKDKAESEHCEDEQKKASQQVDQSKNELKTDAFVKFFTSHLEERPTIASLKSEFKSQKMQEQGSSFKITYSNIVLLKSRLQYDNFPVTELKVNFINPVEKINGFLYEDSSVEYSELVADSINQDMIQQEDEEDSEFEENSAIVNDNICEYNSSYDFSSQSESEEQEKVPKAEIKRGGKWFFDGKHMNEPIKLIYSPVCLVEELFPLLVQDISDDPSNELLPQQKIEMFKQIHGSFTPKDILVRKVNTIVDNKMTMNKISSMIKDICLKNANQRVIKQQIIKELAEEVGELSPNLEEMLENLRSQREKIRNEEIEAHKEEKKNQKQEKIQKLILTYEGNWTLNELRQYLKISDLKMTKSDLNSFIKGKQGQQWIKIREELRNNRVKRGRQPKKQIKSEKKEGKEQKIKNAHLSIEEMMKNNEAQIANGTLKVKKQKSQKSVQENYYIDENDQSFELSPKKKMRKKKQLKKSKKIMVKTDMMMNAPVRRNPRRGKAKIKSEQDSEKMSEDEENVENEQAERDEASKNGEKMSEDEKMDEQEQIKQEKQDPNVIEENIVSQNEKIQNNQNQLQVKLKQEVEEKDSEQRVIDEKIEEVINKQSSNEPKTANKQPLQICDKK